MKMTQPLVSIILPTYNWRSDWLAEAINSVISQTYTNWELIIINDWSTNNIESTILKFSKKEKRINYILNTKNIQLIQTLNKWLNLAQGKYIARIDDDDIWSDFQKLEKQVTFLENNPDHGLCGTGIILIDIEWKEVKKQIYPEQDYDIRKIILSQNPFSHSSIVFRRDILKEVGVYQDYPYTKYTEDYDLRLRIWHNFKLHNIPDYCIKYRLNPEGVSYKNSILQGKNFIKISRKNKRKYPNSFNWQIRLIKNLIIWRIIMILKKIKIYPILYRFLPKIWKS